MYVLNDFLFAPWTTERFQNGIFSLKKQLAPRGNFFSFTVDPIEKGCKIENDKVASPESVRVQPKTSPTSTLNRDSLTCIRQVVTCYSVRSGYSPGGPCQ